MSISKEALKPFNFKFEGSVVEKDDIKMLAKGVAINNTYNELSKKYIEYWKRFCEQEDVKRLKELARQVISEIDDLENISHNGFNSDIENIEQDTISLLKQLPQEEELENTTQVTRVGRLNLEIEEYQDAKDKLVINLTGSEETIFQKIDYRYSAIRGVFIAIILGIVESLVGFDIFRYSSNSLTALASSFLVIIIMTVSSILAAIGIANVFQRKRVERIFARRYPNGKDKKQRDVHLREEDWRYAVAAWAGLAILIIAIISILIGRGIIGIFQMKSYSAAFSSILLTLITIIYFFVELFLAPKYPYKDYKQWEELEDRINKLKLERYKVVDQESDSEKQMMKKKNDIKKEYEKQYNKYIGDFNGKINTLSSAQHIVIDGYRDLLNVYRGIKSEYQTSCKELATNMRNDVQPTQNPNGDREQLLERRIPFSAFLNEDNFDKIKNFPSEKVRQYLNIKPRQFKDLVSIAETPDSK
jgi:low affinity Fe/Cu permease